MKKRWTALLLALCMLVCAGCGGGEPPQVTDDPLPKPEIEVIRTPPEEDADEPEPPEEVPEEPAADVLAWTTEPVLTAEEMPGSCDGLELPVRGATGYTSIELPLWETLEAQAAAQETFAAWEEQQAAEAAQAAEPEPVLPEEDAPVSDSGISASLDVNQYSAGPSGEGEPAAAEPEGEPDAAGDEPSGEGSDAPSEEAQPPASEGETPQEPGEAADPAGTTDPAGAADPAETPEGPEGGSGDSPEGSTEGSQEGAAAEPSEPQLPEPGEAQPEGEPAGEPEEPQEPPTPTTGALAILPPGTPMTVLSENGDWWCVRCWASITTPEGETEEGMVIGWVEHRYCMINLPDVIPSIIYNATNGYSSRFVSCGKTIEGITGQQLYTGKTFNLRFGEEEFMMPVLYSMSFLLCKAQQAALAEGNSLVLYEGYRPMETQMQVANGLRALMKVDKEVKAAVTTPPWSIPWFIATSTSNHQWGYAVDVSLARVKEVDVRQTGDYTYTRVIDYEEYTMPSPIHELSPAAATFTQPIGPNSTTAWKKAKLTATMAACEPALGLQGYCTGVGLSPLASEWWHFNDLASRSSVLDHHGIGDFEITECLSEGPYREG